MDVKVLDTVSLYSFHFRRLKKLFLTFLKKGSENNDKECWFEVCALLGFYAALPIYAA